MSLFPPQAYGLLHIFCSCNIYNYHSSAMSKWSNSMDIGYIYMATNTYASGFIALCYKAKPTRDKTI